MKYECEKTVLVALGGNAILRYKEEGTAEEQLRNVRASCRTLAQLIGEGYHIAITHGNGPQVGDILLRNEMAKGVLPPMPLDFCGAESQGMIGYMLQQCLMNELRQTGDLRPVMTILTQTLVDPNDTAFGRPSKPIGPFYSAQEAEALRKEKGWTVAESPGRGFRRVVPSPRPVSILEGQSIKDLFENGYVVIACGGGGIPVVESEGEIGGVEAVVDKDHSAAVMAHLIGACSMLILTDVESVFLDYGRPEQRAIGPMTVTQAEKWLKEGQFMEGSMGPKVESAIEFVKNGGRRAVITSMEKALEALTGNAGTTITDGRS
ncbi:MAG TPA: carbamate kinase [Methanomassiliicoccales archaeon]|jgi:carbamate kinase